MTRVRMLKSVAAKYRFLPCGAVLRVPEDIDERTAQAWVKAGLAEEDKMLDGPPETKAPAMELGSDKPKRGRRKKCRTS